MYMPGVLAAQYQKEYGLKSINAFNFDVAQVREWRSRRRPGTHACVHAFLATAVLTVVQRRLLLRWETGISSIRACHLFLLASPCSRPFPSVPMPSPFLLLLPLAQALQGRMFASASSEQQPLPRVLALAPGLQVSSTSRDDFKCGK